MRNLPSAIMCGLFVYFFYIYSFHWIFLVLLAAAMAFWEYPVKEGVELVRAQIDELHARTKNMEWNTKLSETTIKVNLATLAAMNAQAGR